MARSFLGVLMMKSVSRRLRDASVSSLAILWAQSAVAQAPPVPDAGAISALIQRSRATIQQREDLQENRPFVLAPQRPPMKLGPGGGPGFVLKKVVFDQSAFIKPEELAAIAAPMRC